MSEWSEHKTADGLHPDGEEQQLMWFMNRARSAPAAEGSWLASSTDPDVADGRDWFGVNIAALQAAFNAIPARAPAAFDRRIYEASKIHADDLIARDAQDHSNQVDRVTAAGFNWQSIRVSVFSYAESALNAHAALNIDWGNGPNGMQDPPGHRKAIMGEPVVTGQPISNVGWALVSETNPTTDVGPYVFAGAYAHGQTSEYTQFLVGTVWNDANSNAVYDPGEGLDGVRVEPDSGAYYAVTGEAGGYAIPVASAATWLVTFSEGDLGLESYVRSVTLGSESVLLDFNLNDRDSDGVDNAVDNCPDTYNPGQANHDNDALGDDCDDDDDNDGTLDGSDAFPFNPDETLDTDSDGMGDNFETTYSFSISDPSDAAEDADDDGWSNLKEFQRGTNPRDPESPGFHPLPWLILLLGT